MLIIIQIEPTIYPRKATQNDIKCFFIGNRNLINYVTNLIDRVNHLVEKTRMISKNGNGK